MAMSLGSVSSPHQSHADVLPPPPTLTKRERKRKSDQVAAK